MPVLLTRLPAGLDLLTLERLPAALSAAPPPVARGLRRLATLVGSDQFLWCVPAGHGLRWPEPDRLTEWKLQLSADRIWFGIDTLAWERYLAGELDDLRLCLIPPDHAGPEDDRLVRLPLLRQEIRACRRLRRVSPAHWRPGAWKRYR